MRSVLSLILTILLINLLNAQELQLPFSDDFSNDYENWTSYSVSGDEQWHLSGDDGIDGSKCARFYITTNPPQANDDWLVSKTFNTESISNLAIEFKFWYHGDGMNPEFYYTTSFTGDVSTTNWTELDNSFWKNEWTWMGARIEIENPGNTFVFAIRYQSTTENSQYILIDNFSIEEFEPDQHLSVWQAASEMKHGINLGNTMEPPTEASWNNPKAQEYYFDLYKEAGFDFVRIPVRWDNYTSKSFPYKIDDEWLNRVEQVVDWGLERGLYIVINAHHEDWLKENYDDPNLRARFDSIWSQVATHFKDKPDKLIFEILNEPTTQIKGLTVEQNDEVNVRILSIIRKTNPTRIVIFQGTKWSSSYDLFQAAIPDDNYLMGTYHSYSPYEFALLGEGTFTEQDYNNLQNEFINVKNWSDASQIPVFLGEFGSLKSCDYNSRMKQYNAYVTLAQEYNIIPCAWDDGGNFRIFERQQKYWDEVKDILIYAGPESPDNLKLEVYQDSIIKVTWNNVITNNDSIFVERRKSTDTSYKRIATLNSGETVFYDVKPDPENTYHYRVIAHYNDTTDIYSYPQRLEMPYYITSIELNSSLKNQFNIYPNPATSESVISFQTKTSGNVNLSVFDIQGRKITTILNKNLPAGSYNYSLSKNIPSVGVYFLRLKTQEGISTQKIISKNE